MVVYPIFKKNLKTVSRSWNYFAMLIVFPVVLIVLAAIMLNSAKLENFRVGVVYDDAYYDLGDINARRYANIETCIYGLRREQVGMCLHTYKIQELTQMDVYTISLDKTIEFYARQFIFERVLSEQSAFIERTVEEVLEKISYYSVTIVNTREDLIETKSALEEEEQLLIQYQGDFQQSKNDFDSVYYAMKGMEADMNRLESDVYAYQADIQNARNTVQNMRSQLSQLENYLASVLTPGEYSTVLGYINQLYSDLDQLNTDLARIEQNLDTQNILDLVNEFRAVMVKMESTKVLLDNVERDLPIMIEKNRAMQIKVDEIIWSLNEAEAELRTYSEWSEGSGTSVRFEKVYEASQDPVFFRFPLLIAIIITFTSIVLSNQFILRGVNHPSYLRAIISPAKDIYFVITNYITNMFFVGIQVAILYGVGYFWVSRGVLNNLFSSLTIVFLATSVFVLIGMSLGYVFKSQNLSTLFATFVTIIFFVFSNILAPQVLAGFIVKFFVNLNPFVILSSELFKLMVIGLIDISFRGSIVKLVVFFVMALVAAYVTKKISKRWALQ